MTDFGPFTFDASVGVLTRDGKLVAIGTRGAALLAALLDADGAPVGKDALMAAAWPDSTVEEANLSVQVANLRKAMGPRPDGQDWIATVPRVGYRLLSAVPAPAAAPELVIPSLAVLPFTNMSGDPEQEYFADGVVEDIITALSRFKSFAVIARNSSFLYKGRAVDVRQVGKELGVRYVLEGSVRRAANRLRISAQIVDAESGAHIWAQNYDGELEDVFDFQDRITESVVTIVEPHIRQAEIDRSRRERPGSLAAYDLYLRGLSGYFIGRRDPDAAAAIERAVALDPNNANYLAMAASLVQHRISMGWETASPEVLARCADYVERALANGRNDAMVVTSCGNTLIQLFHQYDRGFELVRFGFSENPNSLMVVVLAGVGHLLCGDVDVALECFRRAIRLNPTDPSMPLPLTGIAHAHMIAGNDVDALEWAGRSLALNPTYDPTYWILIAANIHLGREAEARQYLADLRKVAPEVTIASIRTGQAGKYPERLAPVLEGLRLAGLPES